MKAFLLSTLLALSLAATGFGKEKSAASAPAPGPSLYADEALWTPDTGNPIKLSSLAGQPVVVALFFTNCPDSCPDMVKNMQSIDAALSPSTRRQVRFVLVSIDPERDTPAALQAYRQENHLPADHWQLLAGPSAQVSRLAALLGFKYVPGSKRNFGHSLLITILNPRGEIVYQQAGENADSREAVRTLQTFAAHAPKHG